jgi:WD40 repeat protein
MDSSIKRLEGLIDVLDEDLDNLLFENELTGLKLDEVPLSPGYHADLKFTFVHEAPILSIAFTMNSDILVTGSIDSTCSIWSSRRGEALFQINMPGPVTLIRIDYEDKLRFFCETRILVPFSIILGI